jgi:hypothetical protein
MFELLAVPTDKEIPSMRRFVLLMSLFLGGTQAAQAGYLDLTNPPTGNGTNINGALFFHGSIGSGTGKFPAFVQITGSGQGNVKEGYNTTVNNVLNNGSADEHNFAVQAGDIPVVNIGGVDYFEFNLDINESNNDTDRYLSLDSLKVYKSDTPNQSVTDPDLLGTKMYDMGAGNGVLLDFNDAPGSGVSDMLVYVPVAGFAVGDFVYLYSKFGVVGTSPPAGAPAGDYGTSDGFEEWGFREGAPTLNNPVPEPASVVLAATALAGLGVTGWRRRKRNR